MDDNNLIIKILIAAFSGFGLVLIRWIIKKIFNRSKRKREQIVYQMGNIVNGDMAGGNIIKTKIKRVSKYDKENISK
ncbi:MAG: hypothetical protein JW866_00355 [Ignavibacteriales bacterium]|nr:hypothetical protein [Ignavibacteriales bacterium]